ncbi:unnamed protein product [Discosporangium mesarthrocarpum]
MSNNALVTAAEATWSRMLGSAGISAQCVTSEWLFEVTPHNGLELVYFVSQAKAPPCLSIYLVFPVLCALEHVLGRVHHASGSFLRRGDFCHRALWSTSPNTFHNRGLCRHSL